MRISRLAVLVCAVAWWVRPLLENCIVDAEHFDFFQDCDRDVDGHGFFLVFPGVRVVVVLRFVSWFL